MIKYSTLVLWLFFGVNNCWAQHISFKVADTTKSVYLMATHIDLLDDVLLSAHDNFKTFKPKSAGTFVCTDVAKHTFIYAMPNDTIEVRLSPKGLIEYSCKANKFRKLESEFINQCFEKYGQTTTSFVKEAIISIERPGLSKYLDPKYIKEQEMLSSYYKKNLVSKEFYDYFMAVYWCLTLFNEMQDAPLSKERVLEIEKSYAKADYYLNISEYRHLLDGYTRKSIEKLGIKAALADNLKFILANYNNQKIKDFLLYKEMKVFLEKHHEQNSVDANSLQLFHENCKNKLFLEEINKDLEPKTAPFFIEAMIKKYRGKLVLVDFWASWCMPCRQEFPYQKVLMKKYPNVHFMFISVDKNYEVWQKASKKYPDILNEGNSSSSILINSDEDKLLQKLNLTPIPRYILFDKEGEIIDINAPRPSSKELETLIEKYL